MSEPVNFPCDDEPLTGEAFERYCDNALHIIATELDATNKDVLNNKCAITRIRQDIDDDFERSASLRESIESLSDDVARFRRSVTRSVACSAAILGAAILAAVSLRKRK